MKYFVLVLEGAADEKYESLGDKTPLEAAEKPTMNMLSYRSFNGLVSHCTQDCCDKKVAAFSMLGYAPEEYNGEESSFESALSGIKLDEEDTVYKCSFVSLSEDGEFAKKRMAKLSGKNKVTEEEAAQLIKALNKGLSTKIKKFYLSKNGVGLLVWKRSPEFTDLHTADEAAGKCIGKYLPVTNAAKIVPMLEKSVEILKDHPVNVSRRERGLKPLNAVWFSDPGKKFDMIPFDTRWSVSASVIGEGMLKNAALCAGMKDAGTFDKPEDAAKTAVEEFKNGVEFTLVCASDIENCKDEAKKAEAIKLVDSGIVAPVYEYLCGSGEEFKLLVAVDMKAGRAEKEYSAEPTPFFLYNSQRTEVGYKPFSELNASKSGFYLPEGEGYKLFTFLIRKTNTADSSEEEENAGSDE